MSRCLQSQIQEQVEIGVHSQDENYVDKIFLSMQMKANEF